ncbi:ribonuclease H-like domain-containing protein, partial [Tanacetum coccineum]
MVIEVIISTIELKLVCLGIRSCDLEAIGDPFGSNNDSINGLDGGNPPHMNPNDSTSISLIPVKLLGTENYHIWSSAMKLALQTRNKFAFVDGSCVKYAYSTSDVLSAQWDRCNAVVDGSIIFNLLQKISSIKQGGSSLADYYHRLNSLWREFDALTKLPTCVCVANKELETHNKLMKLIQFLMGLDDCYLSVRSSLLIKEPLPEVKDAYVIVSREESHRGIPESSSVTKAKLNATSFVAKSSNNFKRSNNNGNNNNSYTRSNNTGNVNRVPNPNLSYEKLLSLINETPSGSIHANMAGANQHLTVSTIGMENVVDISNLKITVGQPNRTLATNLKREIILGTGSESGGLYLFDLQYDKNIGNVNLVHSFHVSKSLWHSRLGHLADQVLAVLKDDLNLSKVTNVSACEICLRAKQTREQFPLSDHKSEKLEGIPLSLWSDCVLTVVYLINRLPTSVLNGKSPYELVYRKKPNLSHLRNFGCLCFSTVLNNSDKFTSRSDKCVLLGYSTVKKAYKLFSLDNRNVVFSRDVRFFESVFPFKMRNTSVNEKADVDYASDADNLTFFDNQLSQRPNDEGRATSVDISLSEGNIFETNTGSSSVPTHNLTSEPIDRVQSEPRRSSRVSKMPAKLNDYVIDSKLKYGLEKHVSYAKLNSMNYCFATTLYKSIEPTNYYEAATDPRWVEAMNDEIDALYRNHTWTIVDLPKGRKAIGNKWIYKIKFKASGEIERYKARLHVNNAFLYGDLIEDVYMTLPLGFGDNNDNKVCKLNKSLYGLKQAPRQWNAKLNAVLVEDGFVQSKFHYSLFIKETRDVFVAHLVYVDDIVITGNCKTSIESFKMFLKNKFMIKDLGLLKSFLGIEVLENKSGISLTQRKYCLELIHEYGLFAAKPTTTPLQENTILSPKESENDKCLKNVTEYQKLVGSSKGFEVFKGAPVTRKSVSGFVVMIGAINVKYGKLKFELKLSRLKDGGLKLNFSAYIKTMIS